MHIPYSIRGALFAPALIALTLVLKVFCPASIDIGSVWFANHLAVPIFLPLILLYATVGKGLVLIHELWFVVLYWSFIGFLIGLILDLYMRRFRYSPVPRPPL